MIIFYCPFSCFAPLEKRSFSLCKPLPAFFLGYAFFFGSLQKRKLWMTFNDGSSNGASSAPFFNGAVLGLIRPRINP